MSKKPKFVKNLKKFIFEFTIVTLGILTAFNINKWDARDSQQEEETLSYTSIKNDLKTDLYVLNYYKKFHESGLSYLKPILDGNHADIDSLMFYLEAAFDLQEGNATYINLKYSGKLEILKNTEIKSKVLLYYETYYQGLESLANRHQYLVYRQIEPYSIKNLKFNYGTEDLEELLKEDEFLNLVKNQVELLELNLYSFERNETLINAIIALLNDELGVEE